MKTKEERKQEVRERYGNKINNLESEMFELQDECNKKCKEIDAEDGE